MRETELGAILKRVADGELSPTEAVRHIRTVPYDDMGFAKIDLDREARTGRPEVVFCLGKTPDQAAAIIRRMAGSTELVIATKADPAHFEATSAILEGDFPGSEKPTPVYHDLARMIVLRASRREGVSGGRDDGKASGLVAVVTAGTADIPIAEEAALAAELYGCEVSRVFDVGVAGLHRLLDKVREIRRADVVIVVAGMEGALASTVGGLVARPVIAVPTSVGYGASMGGLTALFSMLNSCSLGVCVMNIDNGFGAGYLASVIVGDE
ncbi:MAG: nickel pincer cofactor biosynthesis protein LarB [Clostridiales Family XIII bacterium]|jgi:NCAIR mutase (PurE)-related protein|nr:nickel pincer cofactor biosynthesis protein LarB [Clostridiales Family XIII bacterium]